MISLNGIEVKKLNNAHIDLVWENYSSSNTPIDEKNLNKMVRSVNLLNENTTALDASKATKVEVASLVKDIDFDEDTGIFTITRKDSSKYPIKTIDTKLEKLAKNWTFDEKTQKIIIELEDGTLRHVDLSSFIAVFEFINSDTISFYTEYSGNIIKRIHWGGGSIIIMNNISLDMDKISELVCESDLRISKISVNAHKTGLPPYSLSVSIEQGEKRCYIKTAKEYDSISIEVETNDDAPANPLAEFIIKTKGNENITAIVKEGSIEEKHLRPNYLADIKIESGKAETAARSAEENAKTAESFTHGGTGIRPEENTDNAEYYKNEAKKYYDNLQQTGTVTGVKGDEETTYRTGNVNLTPGDIGSPSNEFISEYFVPGYVSTMRSTVEEQGWYRIAESNQYGYSSCVISLKRSYNSPSPEYQKIQLIGVHNLQKFLVLSSLSSTHIWTKIREVWDSNDSKAYIEIYQDRNTLPNSWQITIEEALSVGDLSTRWKAIKATITEEDKNGVNVLASLNLPENFDLDYLAKKDGSNVSGTWNELISGKSIRDSGGNIIKDTYWNKEKELVVSRELSIGTVTIEADGAKMISASPNSVTGYKAIAAFPSRLSNAYIYWNSCYLRESSGIASIDAALKNTSNEKKTVSVYATVLYLRAQ
ncbi:hypothetical protein D3Z36_14465 [Lachnospiraceae bacterium]|nr:hypothetical protein [Lachnospiraceae bacterium]